MIQLKRRSTRNQFGSFPCHGGIVPKSCEPGDVGLAAKPCHLALGIVAMSLLRRRQRLLARKFSAQKLGCLLVAERIERCDALRLAVSLERRSCFLDYPALEHLAGPL